MSAEKTDALVIRLADFSESSKVVTLFTRDFGKVAALAKGAKRLKSAFEAGLDLLSLCQVVFLRKSSGGLDLLTESRLVRRFQPPGKDLLRLYGGYYAAELLDGLTEIHDPHPAVFELANVILTRLCTEDPRIPILQFELQLLRELGHLADFGACAHCGQPPSTGPDDPREQIWNPASGVICTDCRNETDVGGINVTAEFIHLLQQLADADAATAPQIEISPQQFRQLRRLMTSAVSYLLERRPKMLAYLKF